MKLNVKWEKRYNDTDLDHYVLDFLSEGFFHIDHVCEEYTLSFYSYETEEHENISHHKYLIDAKRKAYTIIQKNIILKN